MKENKNSLWTSPERLYVNAAGEIVKADDPSRVKLVCAAGARIPMSEAVRLGLVTPAAPEEAEPTEQSDLIIEDGGLTDEAAPDEDAPVNPGEPAAPTDEDAAKVIELPGVALEVAEALKKAGFDTIEKIKAATDEELTAIPMIGKGTLRKIRDHLAGK
jgi:hypothetical protein